MRDKEEEISILTGHLDEINSTHSFALEKMQSLSKELEREKIFFMWISAPYNPYAASEFDENDFQSENNISIDFASERGNLMDQDSIIQHEHKALEDPNEESNLTLQDELGMLNLEENDVFESRNALYALHDHNDIELGEIVQDSPFPFPEEQKYSPSEKFIHRNIPKNCNLSEIFEKDVKISDLTK